MESIKILRARRLIDGTGGAPLDYPVVVVKDGRILDVGTEGDVNLPRGDSVEEPSFMEGSILPGLIDSHLHIALGTGGGYDAMMRESNGIHLMTGVINAGKALAAGITTVKEAGARDTVTTDLREGWRRGLIEAPRLLISGRPLTVPGGHFHFCNDNTAQGVEEVRVRVRQFVEEDVDVIKIMASGGGTTGTRNSEASFTEEELRASENFQALTLMQSRYEGSMKCIYTDPPYNTDAGPILYKNAYRSASWMALMASRLGRAKAFLSDEGILCITIDDYQVHELAHLLFL